MGTEKLNLKLYDLFGRRSIRKYQEKDVADEMVEDMLKAGMAAPSAVAKDPWRFVVVKNKTLLAKLAAGLPNGKMLAHAGVGFVVCGDLAAAHGQLLSYMLQDCSAAIENILVSAHLLGLGAVWLGVHPREERVAHIRSVLGIPEPVIPISCIAIGYPGETKEPRTRYNAGYVHRERW